MWRVCLFKVCVRIHIQDEKQLATGASCFQDQNYYFS